MLMYPGLNLDSAVGINDFVSIPDIHWAGIQALDGCVAEIKQSYMGLFLRFDSSSVTYLHFSQLLPQHHSLDNCLH